MAKAFAAPSTALVELRGLKTEVYSLRRDKATAELREAEARRELADLTSKVSISPTCTTSQLLVSMLRSMLSSSSAPIETCL